MSYDDLRELGSESAVKAAGKVRQQGKPYESVFFLFFRSFFVSKQFFSGRRRHRILEVRGLSTSSH